MNQSDYRALIQACDKILTDPSAGFFRIAIPWLHVSNEHPVNLNSYTSLFGEPPKRWFVWMRRIAGLLWSTVRGRWSLRPWYTSTSLPDTADILFVSHMVSRSHVGGDEDFYYGRLPEVLTERGFSCAIVLIDHIGLSRTSPTLEWPARMAPRILLPRVINSLEELKFRLLVFRESWRMLREARKADSDFQRWTLRLAAQQAPASASADALRLSKQILDLMKRFNPRAIITTYEGHAWERLAFAAARSACPQVRCIGYQHAVMFRRQHALLRSLGGEFDPDTILTSGSVTRDLIVRAHNIDDLDVRILGTHRRSSTQEPLRDLSTPICLVIPDGVITECLFLFEFALRCASLAPNVTFVMRLHPIISVEEIADHDPRIGDVPDNLELSELSIQDDFARSSWAAYRGTSAAIHAVLAGLRPLYVSRLGEMPIDPLFELEVWRREVYSPKDLVAQVESDLNTDWINPNEESTTAIEYCKRYFVPLDPSVIEAVI